MTKADVLIVSQIPPFLRSGIEERYILHDLRPDVLPAELSRIRAVVGMGGSLIEKSFIDSMPKLELISICGVGYERVDLVAAKARGIAVTFTPDVLNDDVADLAMGLLLSLTRQIHAADQFTRAGRWLKETFPLTRKPSGGRLGIVGLGRIGTAIARRAAAFDMQISYTSRHARDDVSYPYYPSVIELAEAVDFLVVITPGGATTKNLINADVLKALGPRGYLINVARGSVVDETALIEALRNKEIAGAGLDVYADEPRVAEALRLMNNVVLTPHFGSGTVETRKAMSDLVLANLDAHFAGRPLPTPVPECGGGAGSK